MRGQTVVLVGPAQRELAHRLVNAAPVGAVVNVREASRSNEQNAKMWAMLSDISRSKPEGRKLTPDLWKAAFMNALGYQTQFLEGIDGGQPFPVGFKTSRLTVGEMADLITFIQEYGDRHEVTWNEPSPYAQQ